MTNTRADDLERVLVTQFVGSYQVTDSGVGLLGTNACSSLAAVDTGAASGEQVPSRESGEISNDKEF